MNCMMKNLNLSRIPSRIFPKEDYNKEINIPKIDNNEKKVLQRFCSNSRVCLNKLAKELSLSPTAIAKIQKRLEKKEIIKKYSIKVNSSKLGINIFSFIIAKEKTPLVNGLDDWANKEPNIVCCYKSIDCSTIILLCAFTDMNDLDHYLNSLQAINKDFIEIENIYILSPKGIIYDSFESFNF